MTIPHRIRALLALRGWTVAQLAQAAGLPHATVATHLRGRTDLTGRASGRPLSSRPPVDVYAQALAVPVAVLTEAWPVEALPRAVDQWEHQPAAGCWSRRRGPFDLVVWSPATPDGLARWEVLAYGQGDCGRGCNVRLASGTACEADAKRLADAWVVAGIEAACQGRAHSGTHSPTPPEKP